MIEMFYEKLLHGLSYYPIVRLCYIWTAELSFDCVLFLLNEKPDLIMVLFIKIEIYSLNATTVVPNISRYSIGYFNNRCFCM